MISILCYVHICMIVNNNVLIDGKADDFNPFVDGLSEVKSSTEGDFYLVTNYYTLHKNKNNISMFVGDLLSEIFAKSQQRVTSCFPLKPSGVAFS